ncbi:beta-1,6-N-acetylglucosaminyltransferase [Acinetobacter gyllenbergii]|uniref:beta-1,6-N-acetylglucosaminyltransferase n=1 Tax=Acinetobacter gyllenbergii TaxID=134534 RepID=UPI00241F5663|nr:beta-1,6-N-acetylglucosaminyltransferase [Acinetobacter gyllenbergii]
MKKNYLILTHKNIDHIYKLASNMLDANFYIHVDLKADINKIRKDVSNIENVFFVENRVDVKWAGFSMVQATLNLMKYAIQHDESNEYFHLISGDDVFLIDNFVWDDSQIYMECLESKPHRYRMRFNAPHADTLYQRSILGKLLTQCYKVLDKIFPTNEKTYFGSQWFSIRREQLQKILDSISVEDIEFFRKKLCPDEHFFQYLVVKNSLLTSISSLGNRRSIIFDPNYQHGSSPIFLTAKHLLQAKAEGYWFARKVEQKVMYEFYKIGK